MLVRILRYKVYTDLYVLFLNLMIKYLIFLIPRCYQLHYQFIDIFTGNRNNHIKYMNH